MTTEDETRKAQQRTRKAAERTRKREAGQKPFEVWAHPDDWPAISALADKLARKAQAGLDEIRGLYAPKSQHKDLKPALKRLIDEAKGKK